MNYKEQEMVERLKDNWVVVGGLTLDEKVFLEKHIRSCIEIDIYGRGEEAELPLRIGSLVRLSPDFQLPAPAIEAPAGYRLVPMEDLKRCKFPRDCVVVCYRFGAWWDYPSGNLWTKSEAEYAVPSDYVFAEDRPKERWFFSNKTHVICEGYTCNDALRDTTEWIEITAAQKLYLETKPEPKEGFEWVLKVPSNDEQWQDMHGAVGCWRVNDAYINGIRWVKVPVKVEPCFVEYPIENHCGTWKCKVEHRKELIGLAKLPSIVGFAGVKFEEIGYSMCLSAYKNGHPATPIKARFYINGETK